MKQVKLLVLALVLVILVIPNTIAQVPSQGVQVSPADSEAVSELPTFVWSTDPLATSYRLQISADPTFNSFDPTHGAVDSAGILTNSFTSTVNLDLGSPYYWRVRGVNGSGAGDWSVVRTILVSSSGQVEPPVPVPTNPSTGVTIHGWDATLAWYCNYFGNELTYTLEYVETDSTALATSVAIGMDTTTYSMTSLNANSTYYWRVKAIKGANESAFSAFQSFTTPPLVAATVPVCSWPTGGTEIYNTTPTLYWYLNSNSVGLTFNLEYNLVDTTFTSGVVSVPSLGVMNYTLPALTAGQTVYWRVQSDNGAQQSAWSSVGSFTVANTAAVPVQPTISWPQGGAIVYATSSDLNWYVNANSTNLYYEVQFRTATISDNTVDYTTAANTFSQAVSLNWATTYYWRVRSADGVNPPSAWSTEATFSTFGVAGANVPIQSWPLEGITSYGSSQQLNWYLNGPSSGYTYDVEVNGSVVATNVDTTSYVYGPLVAGGTYIWRVRSNIGVSQSSWSPAITFYAYTGYGSIAPRLGSPVNGISVTTSRPELSWYVNSPTSGLQYDVEVSSSANFANATVVSNVGEGRYKTEALSDGKTYYWRVRSKDKDGHYSNYSRSEVFAVNGVTGVEGSESGVPSTYSLEQNYPNPFNPTTIIRYGIPKDAGVKIEIYNMLGQKVRELVNGEMKAGSYKVEWNGENEIGEKVASGAYIYRITAGSFVKSLKLLLLK